MVERLVAGHHVCEPCRSACKRRGTSEAVRCERRRVIRDDKNFVQDAVAQLVRETGRRIDSDPLAEDERFESAARRDKATSSINACDQLDESFEKRNARMSTLGIGRKSVDVQAVLRG